MNFKTPFIAYLFICCAFTCSAQDTTNSQFAKVYFMRSSGAMGLTAFSAFIDDTIVCHLHNNRFSIHTIQTGLHKFQLRADGKKPKKNIKTLDIEVKASLKYYIMLDVTDHYFVGTLSLIEITENTARKTLPKMEEEKNCGL